MPVQFINGNAEANGSICGATGAVTLDAPPPDLITVTFTFDFEGDGNPDASNGTCAALRVTNVPAFTIFVKESGQVDADARWVGSDPVFTSDNLQRINGGSLVVSGLEVGKTYVFYSTINNEREERSISITGPSMLFDMSGDVQSADICSQ